jgi:pyridoxal phosphate enzyme (YggS family)
MNGVLPLLENHVHIAARILAICQAHRRDPATVSLLAVSKSFPHTDILTLASAGQRAFGENYLQEALDKITACRAERPETSLEWHFIGPIQSNKTRAIAEYFDWVHSIEREKVAQRLSAQRPAHLPPLQVCLQVNVSNENSKSGCAPDEAPALAERIAALPRLRLRGLMAIPEPNADPDHQRARFAAVRACLERCRARGLILDTLSMGMSADLDAAIAEGATIVRVGTALFGARPYREEKAGN